METSIGDDRGVPDGVPQGYELVHSDAQRDGGRTQEGSVKEEPNRPVH